MDHSVEKIMILSRWSSDAFMVYIRPQVLEWTNIMSRDMVRAGNFRDLNEGRNNKPRRDTSVLGLFSVFPKFNLTLLKEDCMAKVKVREVFYLVASGGFPGSEINPSNKTTARYTTTVATTVVKMATGTGADEESAKRRSEPRRRTGTCTTSRAGPRAPSLSHLFN
jgi:hypothetical protein